MQARQGCTCAEPSCRSSNLGVTSCRGAHGHVQPGRRGASQGGSTRRAAPRRSSRSGASTRRWRAAGRAGRTGPAASSARRPGSSGPRWTARSRTWRSAPAQTCAGGARPEWRERQAPGPCKAQGRMTPRAAQRARKRLRAPGPCRATWDFRSQARQRLLRPGHTLSGAACAARRLGPIWQGPLASCTVPQAPGR